VRQVRKRAPLMAWRAASLTATVPACMLAAARDRRADMQNESRRSVTAAKGRELEVLVTGPSDGLPLVFHHGTPGGVAVYPPMLAAATQRGLRLVLYARPGYGDSTPAAGRSVADAASDVAAILDSLSAPRFVTAGWSGGGPHAIACARLLPDRCLAAVSLAGVAPYTANGLDWLAGMGEENITEFAAAREGDPALTAMLTGAAAEMRELTAEQLSDGLGDLLSAADRDAMQGELADWLLALFQAGLRSGVAGWRDDDLAFVADWGFPLGPTAGSAPVAIWQGEEDRMVPLAHGQWLAANVAAERVHIVPAAGHLNLPFGAVFDELLELAAGR
jgi:pimeloyl-ACP methyl ester carboxylesterase